MLLSNLFHTDENNHERIPFTTQAFPYTCMKSEMEKYTEQMVPWHWHVSCEIIVITQGSVELKTPDQKIVLNKGDAAFVNTGTLHMYTMNGTEPAVLYAHLFRSEFLAGSYESIFEEKYFRPVCRCSALQAWPVRPDDRMHMDMISKILRAAELAGSEPPGYEFAIRSALCQFWHGLYMETETLRAKAPVRNTLDTERIKRMMDFIQAHYPEPLSVEEIGASADISVRECNRCFQRCLGMSPVTYLTEYRIRAAAKMLQETSLSVLEISENCGFSSSSYFSRVFREATGSTPKAYQKKLLSQA